MWKLVQETFHFYQNENDLVSALKSGAVEAASGISPAVLSELKGFTIDQSSLNRVFGVFFNDFFNIDIFNDWEFCFFFG
jgi:hypothetical protein